MDLRMLFALIVVSHTGFTFLSMPPALNTLMTLYNVSYTGISILLSALLWSHAIMQIPAGLFADRIGAKRALFTGLSFLIIGNLLAAIVPSLELALVGRVITGLGTGLTFVTSMKLIALHAPKERIGTFQAFSAGCFSIGSILAYLLIPKVVTFGWQWVYLVPALICAPLLAVLALLSVESEPGTLRTMAMLGRLFRTPSAWIIGMIHALSWGTVITFGNWMPSLLAEVWGSSMTIKFAWGGALSMLASGIGRWMGGFFLIRFPALFIVRGTILALMIIFAGLFLIPTPSVILCLAMAATWFASINFGALFQQASRNTSIDYQGTIFGFINFLGNVGAILFILLFGWIKDSLGSFEWGFAFLAVWALVSFLLSRTVKSK